MANKTSLKKEILANLPSLRRYAYSLTGNQHDADDLLQEVVEKLLDRPIPPDVEMKVWAFKVCKNRWIDTIRTRNVRNNAIATGELEQDDYFDGEKSIVNKLTFNQVIMMMNTLTDDLKATLSLVAIEGFSYAEVASILDVPIGTVMSRVSRARSILKEKMPPE